MSECIIKYKFNLPEEETEMLLLTDYGTAWNTLYNIDQSIGTILKYTEHEWLNDECKQYLDELREKIAETGIHEKYD